MSENPVAEVDGITTCMGFKIQVHPEWNTKLRRTDFLTINHENQNFLLSIQKIWRDNGQLYAQVRVLGEIPKTPFQQKPIYLAAPHEIQTILQLEKEPRHSLYLGNLISTHIPLYFQLDSFGRIFITGKSGSGKSYTVGVLVEELIKQHVPVVIIDRHAEYSSLKVVIEQEFPKDEPFFQIEDPAVAFANHIVEFADKTYNPNADLDLDYLYLAPPEELVTHGQCIIINLRGLSIENQKKIVLKLLHSLYEEGSKGKIPPYFLFIDEAHEFCGKQKDPLSDVVRLISMEGRKFGMNLAIITQRPQALDVNIRSQAGTWIIHKLTDLNDINITCKSAEGLSLKEDEEIIQMLNPGESIIAGEIVPFNPIQIQIRKRYTLHGGAGFNITDLVPDAELFSISPLIRQLRNATSPDKLSNAHERRTSKILTLTEYESLSNSLVEERDHLMEIIEEKTRQIEILKKENLDLFNKQKTLREELQKQKKRAEEAVDIAERTLSELKQSKGM
ncbi:MAG: DUF87 domain-containing protein [Candidatus Lokiarchaeota archaeon]|nr:DUF87 domain-containing protein [Candidatus Lokiarchaeota archaeon]